MDSKTGFIGMGIMGQRMAANLLKGGYEVMVYNRSREKAAPLADQGARVAATPQEVGQWADVIILMLTGPEAVNAVLEGDNGILATAVRGKTLINMSTVAPAYTRQLHGKLQAQAMDFIDAPVSGSKKPAEDGTLVILAGGDRKSIAAHEPLFLAMGKKVIYCGDAGQGSSMKMMVNLLLGIMMTGISEAINFGQHCGLDTATMLDTILAGPLGCGLYSLKAEMLATDQYPVQFPLKHMAKDLGFTLATAGENGSAVPVGTVIHQLYGKASEQRLSDLDFAAVKKVLASLSS